MIPEIPDIYLFGSRPALKAGLKKGRMNQGLNTQLPFFGADTLRYVV